MSSNKKGVFLAVEGVDGTGKSTVVKWMKSWFDSHGIDAIATREPGGTPIAEKIRNTALSFTMKDLDVIGDETFAPMTDALLMMAARAQHIDKLIKPSLAKGQVVITDRYFDSTLCYQGAGQGIDLVKLKQLHALTTDDFHPRLTFVLTGDLGVFHQRMMDRGGLNRLDSVTKEFHAACDNLYRTLAAEAPYRYIVIDASGSIESVIDTIEHQLIKSGLFETRTPAAV